MEIYTRKGDDGTTGLLYGGRVRKNDAAPEACGQVDEAQAQIGLARAHANNSPELEELLVGLERDLWVAMAELSCPPDKRDRLVAGESLVTEEMVSALERKIDEFSARFQMPTEFVLPGEDITAANLDVARAVVRRAERACVDLGGQPSLVVKYLNRLSDLLWTLARWQEGSSRPSRT